MESGCCSPSLSISAKYPSANIVLMFEYDVDLSFLWSVCRYGLNWSWVDCSERRIQPVISTETNESRNNWHTYNLTSCTDITGGSEWPWSVTRANTFVHPSSWITLGNNCQFQQICHWQQTKYSPTKPHSLGYTLQQHEAQSSLNSRQDYWWHH